MRYYRVGRLHHLNPGFVPVDAAKAAQKAAEAAQAHPLPTPTPEAGTPQGEPAAPSRGLGDTVAKFFDAMGVSRVVKAVAGENCGCKHRQEMLNRLVPYEQPK